MTTMGAGFDDPVRGAQAVFRAILDAMARPGRIASLATDLAPPHPLLGTSAALLLALADFETTVWLDEPLAGVPSVGDYLRFHTGARIVPACREADFAVIAAPARMPPLTAFGQGTPEYPDRSTTVIIQIDALANQDWQFSGPGILDHVSFRASPLPADFPDQFAANRSRFPCGVDLVFVTTALIAALPRSTRIAENA
jgi:alpha-D-ribose 1-methylphosphonate 5-triphosphate synthase subunit PhnH